RRLAIIDLESGAQPLENETGSVRVVCNGEIYNYRELRRALEASGHRFRTVSDCETIVHLYEEHGPDAVARLHGMFALAIWDRTLKRLVLARDRLGIKPLFYSAGAQGFGFASGIKALLAARMTRSEVHPDALLHYLSCGYVPGTDTIYRDVHRLAPGELLVLDPRGLHRRPYWTLQPGEPLRSRTAAAEELRALLTVAVREHLVSDVPVGVFLSGGVDSSVVSTLAAVSAAPLRTFSVTFPEDPIFHDARFSRPRESPRGNRPEARAPGRRRRRRRHRAALRTLGEGVRGSRGARAGPGLEPGPYRPRPVRGRSAALCRGRPRRPDQPHALHGLPARAPGRHARQGRHGEHGQRPRGSRSVPGSSGRRIRLPGSGPLEDRRHARQAHSSPGVPGRAPARGRPPGQARLRAPGW